MHGSEFRRVGGRTVWMVVGNPWVGVFAVGIVLGLYMLENCALQAWLGAARAEVRELEKQVVGLRTTIHRMVQAGPNAEVERRRAGFRRRCWSSRGRPAPQWTPGSRLGGGGG